MSDQNWASWCPCCRDYDFTEQHLKHCALHDAQALNAELVEALRKIEALSPYSNEVGDAHAIARAALTKVETA